MKKLALSLIVVLVTLQVWSHGEDKPGPHGGFISMPGAFHVELVPVNSRQIKAYLLDINWKNPTLKNSSIQLSMGSISSKCAAKADHFVCNFPASIDLNKTGELKVDSTRENKKGSIVTYSLPLKLKAVHEH